MQSYNNQIHKKLGNRYKCKYTTTTTHPHPTPAPNPPVHHSQITDQLSCLKSVFSRTLIGEDKIYGNKTLFHKTYITKPETPPYFSNCFKLGLKTWYKRVPSFNIPKYDIYFPARHVTIEKIVHKHFMLEMIFDKLKQQNVTFSFGTAHTKCRAAVCNDIQLFLQHRSLYEGLYNSVYVIQTD